MAEYIERDAAVKAVMDAMWVSRSDEVIATLIIKGVPAAEVEPVIYAYWSADDEYLTCSRCGESYLAGDTRHEVRELLRSGQVHKRCHGCGARMYGAQQETDEHGKPEDQTLVDEILTAVALRYGEEVAGPDDQGRVLHNRLVIARVNAKDMRKCYEIRAGWDDEKQRYIIGVLVRDIEEAET